MTPQQQQRQQVQSGVWAGDPPRRYLRVREVAEELGIKPSTLTSYVSRRQCPPPDTYLDRRTPAWEAETVADWVASRTASGA